MGHVFDCPPLSIRWSPVDPSDDFGTDVLGTLNALNVMVCTTSVGDMFAFCLLPSGLQAWCFVVKTKGTELLAELLLVVEKIVAPPALSPLPSPRLRLQSAPSPSPLPLQQLPSVLLQPVLVSLGIFFVLGPEHSVDVLVVTWYHPFDSSAVLFVFVFMIQGQGEALPGLYPSGVRRHAHPVGLRHAPSFQPSFESSFKSVCQCGVSRSSGSELVGIPGVRS